MADLQQRLDELQRQVNDANSRDGGQNGDAVTLLEQSARELLADAKNTPYERSAQALFAQIARLNNNVTSPNAAHIRGLLRRARIRIEIAGDDDDIDEAVDILTEALTLAPNDEDVLSLLQEAASKTPAARQRVNDLFMRHGLDRAATTETERVNPDTLPSGSSSGPPSPTPPPSQAPVPPATYDQPPVRDTRTQYQTPPPERAPTPPPQSPVPPRSQMNDEGNYASRQAQPAPRAGYSGSNNELDSLLSEMTQAYYAGEYQQTVDIANRILAIQANNPTASEYREKSEDNIIRGVVPDHRIPFDARVSYNRANSLVRAGNYEDAERLYREARDLAERSGILNWKDAEQAMLDIQDLALARELINEGDRMMTTDNWSEALRKYEGALRVVPNDPQAEERIETIRRVQQEADQAAVQLSMLSGSLSEQVTQLHNVMGILVRVRQLLPNSKRLAQLQSDANNRMVGIKTQILDQAQSLASRAQNATTLDDRVSLNTDALRLLELGVELDPSDTRIAELMSQTRSESNDSQRAKQVIERAAALVAQNFDNELSQAKSMLAELLDYAQDERYRNVVNDLLSRYVERAEIALEEGDLVEAQAWLDAAREEPFRVLGRRAEVQRLDTQIRNERRRSRLIAGAAGGGIIIVILVALLLTRDSWLPVINPPPTETPTLTPTASETSTPSLTPTASETSTPSDTPTPSNTPSTTPTPTWTVTPSLTATPSETPTETHTPTHTYTPTPSPTKTLTPTDTLTPTITPTPLSLCEVGVVGDQAIRVRSQPSVTASQLTVLPVGSRMEVYEQDRINGFIWYRVRTLIEGNTIEGWVREDTVTVLGRECPLLPESDTSSAGGGGDISAITETPASP